MLNTVNYYIMLICSLVKIEEFHISFTIQQFRNIIYKFILYTKRGLLRIYAVDLFLY